MRAAAIAKNFEGLPAWARSGIGKLVDLSAMEDIDSLFARIRDLPLDPRLVAIDDSVLDALARRKHSRVSATAMALVAVISLGAGLAGSMAPAEPVRTAAIFPLGAPAALAPSTLLGADE